VKNKFRNPFEEKKPKKFGRLSQLSKANRKAKNVAFTGLRRLESDWQSEKRWGETALVY
jgi:hypothetical protein